MSPIQVTVTLIESNCCIPTEIKDKYCSQMTIFEKEIKQSWYDPEFSNNPNQNKTIYILALKKALNQIPRYRIIYSI